MTIEQKYIELSNKVRTLEKAWEANSTSVSVQTPKGNFTVIYVSDQVQVREIADLFSEARAGFDSDIIDESRTKWVNVFTLARLGKPAVRHQSKEYDTLDEAEEYKDIIPDAGWRFKETIPVFK